MQEAYSHEVSSCGFWPGNGGYGKAAFYSYAYPEPTGFADASVRPDAAAYDHELGQFILLYARFARRLRRMIVCLEFLESMYAAAADLAHWDRAALERAGAS